MKKEKATLAVVLWGVFLMMLALWGGAYVVAHLTAANKWAETPTVITAILLGFCGLSMVVIEGVENLHR